MEYRLGAQQPRLFGPHLIEVAYRKYMYMYLPVL